MCVEKCFFQNALFQLVRNNMQSRLNSFAYFRRTEAKARRARSEASAKRSEHEGSAKRGEAKRSLTRFRLCSPRIRKRIKSLCSEDY